MTKNIKDIVLLTPEDIENIHGAKQPNNLTPFGKTRKNRKILVIEFNYPCTWSTLSIDELKEIIRLWIKAEEETYPIENGFQGRWLFKKEVDKVFYED